MTTANRNESESPPRERAKRQRSEPKLYISFLPEGRGGPREDKGSVPLEVDVEAHIEERTDCEPGLYRIEKKRSGEFSGEVLFYEKGESDLEDAAAVDFAATADVEPDLRRLVASTISATLEAQGRRDRPPDPMEQFRQMRELLKEERAEMQRQLSEQSPASPDPLQMFERFVELQKKLQPEVPQSSESELSAKDRAQLMLVKDSGLIPQFMKSMRDLLRAPEEAVEPKGFVEKALEYLQGWTPYIGPVLAPVVGGKISDVVSRLNVEALAERINAHPGLAQSANTANAAQPVAPEQSALEAELFQAMGVVVECITLDTDDSDGEQHLAVAASAVRSFLERNPMAEPAIAGMFSQSSASLVMQLAASRPEWGYVAKLGNAERFIGDLKDLLTGGDESDEMHQSERVVNQVAPVAANANGANHGAKVNS